MKKIILAFFFIFNGCISTSSHLIDIDYRIRIIAFRIIQQPETLVNFEKNFDKYLLDNFYYKEQLGNDTTMQNFRNQISELFKKDTSNIIIRSIHVDRYMKNQFKAKGYNLFNKDIKYYSFSNGGDDLSQYYSFDLGILHLEGKIYIFDIRLSFANPKL